MTIRPRGQVSSHDAGAPSEHPVSPDSPGLKASGGRSRTVLIYWVIFAWSALVSGSVVAHGRAGFQDVGQGTTSVQDFASHLTFTRAVWIGSSQAVDSTSVYSVAAHRRIMSDWMGRAVSFALPFGYFPTMLWVLLPLCFLPIPVAYLIWTGAGAAAAGWMVSRTRSFRVFGVLAFLTPIAAGAIALGQTAILETAGLYVLAHRTLGRPPSVQPGITFRGGALVLALWALTAKPPLAVTGAVALLALRHLKPVAGAVAVALLTTAVLTPWLGHGWIADYAHLIGHYDRIGADPAFAWSLVPEHMSNMRALLSVDFGVPDDVAARVSNACWFASLGLLLAAGLRRWLRPPAVWGLAILSFLLFCSHVSSTDSFTLLLVPAIAAPVPAGTSRWRASWPWIAVLAGLSLSPALGPAAGIRPSVLFFVEVTLAMWLVVSGRSSACRAVADDTAEGQRQASPQNPLV